VEILSVEIVASEFQPLSGLEGAGGFEHPFTGLKETCLGILGVTDESCKT